MTRLLAGLLLAFLAAGQTADQISFVARDARAALLEPGGQAVVLSFTADPAQSGGDLFHTIVSKAGAEVVLVTPAGIEINAANAESQGFVHTSFESVPNSAYFSGPAAIPGYHTFIELPAGATPGEYKIRVAPGSVAATATVQSFYTSSSPIRVALAPGAGTVRAGEPIAFSAMIYEGTTPLAGATATLRIRLQPDLAAPAAAELNLPDSGPLNESAGDGLYVNFWTPERPGRYTAALRMTGASSTGAPYSRLATADFVVQPPLARLDTISDSAIDDNGDGTPDRMIVSAKLNVAMAGRYQLLLNLRSQARFVTARPVFTLEQGIQRVEVPFSFAELADLAPSGPYGITNVLLVYLGDPEAPVADERPDAGVTGAYVVSQLTGVKPVTAAPASLAFGDVEMGSEKSLDITLRNTASYPFTEAVMRVSNSAFTTVPAPVTIFAGESFALSVRFRPAATGTQSGAISIAGLTIALTANGVVATVNAAPAVTSLNPASAPAGGTGFTLTVDGTNFTRTSVIRWNGSARTTTFVSSTRLTAPIAASDIAGTGTAQITVFTPAPGGGTSSALPFSIAASSPTGADLEVTPAALAFGDVTTGQNKTLALTIRNSGGASLAIQSIASTSAVFTVTGATIPTTVAPGATTAFNVRFAPTAAGVQAGTLTITSNAAGRPAVQVSVNGTGIAGAGPRTTTLQVDDGTFETGIGFVGGLPSITFVNRLTPPSYPATIRRVEIFFGADADELPVGHPITVIAGTNPSGGANINGISFQRTNTTIGFRPGFNVLTLTTPVTITSGDFVVGFTTQNPPNVYPMASDNTPPLRQRSYASADGVTFSIIDTFSRDLASNFAIRAVVELPAP